MQASKLRDQMCQMNTHTAQDGMRSSWIINAPADAVAIVTGSEAIDAELNTLAIGALQEIDTLAPGGGHSPAAVNAAKIRDSKLFARGIQLRTIYLDTVRNSTHTLKYVQWLNEHGAEVRTTARLPIRMIISDHKTAFLPLDMDDGNTGLIVHRSPSAVIALQELFEKTWAAATPLGMVRAPDGRRLTDEARAILELVALGQNDVEIARRLGMSERTVRRRIEQIEDKLGVSNRYRAIYIAAKTGII